VCCWGDFNGVTIRKLMDGADSIMNEVFDALVEHKREECTLSNNDIQQLCTNVKLALTMWDGIFSAINKEDPTEQHCNETQEKINLAMLHMRTLGFSITPKLHGLESHVVEQMRSIKGGIVHLIEQWVEHSHQTRSRCDDNWKTLNYKMQALIRSRRESWGGLPQVQKEVDAVDAKFRRKRSDNEDGDLSRVEKRAKAKEENRRSAFDQMRAQT
jgi:hypothetical protein